MDNYIEAPTPKQLEDKYKQSYYVTKEYKTCQLCGCKFKHGRAMVKTCNLCTLVYECAECGSKDNRVLTSSQSTFIGLKSVISGEINIKDYKKYCSKACVCKNNGRYGLTKEACTKRMESMKENGSYAKWRESCESSEARKLGYANMVKNGKVKNLISASCAKEAKLRAVKARMENGSWDSMICKVKYCDKCNRRTKQVGPRCFGCNPWKVSFGSGTFDRDTFYGQIFKNISVSFDDHAISLDQIDKYLGISGVWAVFGLDGLEKVCLDVCQTKDIGKEMYGWLRNANACKDKTDDEIYQLNEKYMKYNRIKKRDIMNHEEISFSIVKINVETKEDREKCELLYAYQNKAKYWSPAPGQSLKVEE